MDTHDDNISDAEDIPSDFFDDFNKDEFIQGLSVIDSWDEDKQFKRARINADTLDKVKDLRELIRESKTENRRKDVYYKQEESSRKMNNRSHLDVKPGSRRDPSKTKEAIKKDKEVKVKQYLAKHLESSDDLRPPGTELDDYFDENKLIEMNNIKQNNTDKLSEINALAVNVAESTKALKNKQLRECQSSDLSTKYETVSRQNSQCPQHIRYGSPRHHSSLYLSPQHRRSQSLIRQRSPRRSSRQRNSPYRSSRQRPPMHSPHRHSPHRHSPHRHSSHQRSPHWRSPRRRSPHQHSPYQHSSYRRSPHQHSPHRRSSHWRSSHRDSFHQTHRSVSPRKNSFSSQCSPSLGNKEKFPYPEDSYQLPPSLGTRDYYSGAVANEYHRNVPGYSYPQGITYINDYTGAYGFGAQAAQSAVNVPQTYVPQPVPAPAVAVAAAPSVIPTAADSDSQLISVAINPPQATDVMKSYGALTKLVEEGKISEEDYLKLTPNKGAPGVNVTNAIDIKTKNMVFNRCNRAFINMETMVLPNRLVMNNNIISQELKSLTPKYCSPLKRQMAAEFHFAKKNAPVAAELNKKLIDTLITSIGLDKVMSKHEKKISIDRKDVAVQTIKSCCEVCEVRDSTIFHEAGTSTDLEHFTSSIHTQVIEQDLLSSKVVFTPSGSIADGAPISISHMTPAQLVSQLAAKAKTLKQNFEPVQPSNQFIRRNHSNTYDINSGQYQNNYNYRY